MIMPVITGKPKVKGEVELPAPTEDASQKFLDALLGVVVPPLIGALPGMIQTIMGERKKAGVAPTEGDEEAIEKFLPGLLQAVLPTFVQVLPGLVEAIAGQKEAIVEEPPPDEEAVEKFLPALLGGLIPALVRAVPDIVAAFQPGQKVVGPAPKATDPEMREKFFGPILAGCIPVAMQVLPELVRVLAGAPKDVVTFEEVKTSKGWFQLVPFHYSQLSQPTRLADRDLIQITTREGQTGMTQITLSQAAHRDWWKGVGVEDGHGHQMGFVEVWGDTKSADMEPLESRRLTAGRLVLWKAKLFGAHTPIYTSPTDGLEGRQVAIDWLEDG
jgi:hypothetical protein